MKTMKATEVLKRYKDRERDFRGINLRGQSFKNKNLSGADFSKADIRGTNFTKANLEGTNFSYVEAGLQRRWVAFLVLASLCLSAISGLLSGFTGYIVVAGLSSGEPDGVFFGICFFALLIIFVGITFWKDLKTALQFLAGILGFAILVLVFIVTQTWSQDWGLIGDLAKALSWFTVLAVILAIAVAAFRALDWNKFSALLLPIGCLLLLVFSFWLMNQRNMTSSDEWKKQVAQPVIDFFIDLPSNWFTSMVEQSGNAIPFLSVLILALALILAWASASILAEAEFLAVVEGTTRAGVVGGFISRVFCGIIAVLIAGRIIETQAIAGFIALAMVVLGAYFGWRALGRDEKFAFAWKIAVAFSTTGGTNFYDANLTKADFTKAILKSTDFRKATLTHSLWYNAQKLDYALVSNSYLKNPKLQKLVTTNQGQGVNFNYLNLQGINLHEANLVGASFIGTNLNEAILEKADLSRAKLEQTQLDRADLTGAILTDTTIKDPIITATTKLDVANWQNVPRIDLAAKDCEYNRLRDSFTKVEAITNSVKQKYELMQEAERLKVPLDYYQKMYDSYCEKQKEPEWLNLFWVEPFHVIERWVEGIAYWFERLDIFKVLEKVGLLIAVFVFLLDYGERKEKNQYEAWQVITSSVEQGVSGGRIQALESINKEHRINKERGSLAGLQAEKADLAGVQLEKADLRKAVLTHAILNKANLKRANLRGADLQYAQLDEADLDQALYDEDTKLPSSLDKKKLLQISPNAELLEANLQYANLSKANLRDAILIKANLHEVNFYRANLRGANLQEANLHEVNFYRANLRGANLHRAKTSPLLVLKK